MPIVLDWAALDVEKDIRFGAPKRNATGGISIPLSVHDKESDAYVPFIHQTPQLNLPFGISKLELGKDTCYKADFGFTGVRQEENGTNFFADDESVLAYFRFIENLESFIKKTAFTQCRDWFKKEHDLSKIEEIYCTNIKGLQNASKYSPTFPTKLKIVDARGDQKATFKTDFFDEDGERITFEDLDEVQDVVPRGSKAIALLETAGLWFNRTGFGISFKVAQMMVFKKDAFRGCAIRVPQKLQRAIVANFSMPEEKKRLRDDEIFPAEDCKIRKIEAE